ncbi:MAG: histidine kinase [Chloroflexi bacterium]|nr:histidine kinase [Chloroflexota bacterium]
MLALQGESYRTGLNPAIDLDKCVDVQALEQLLATFVQATGLPAGCGIFDLRGKRVVPVDLKSFPRLCRVAWTSASGQERCREDFRKVIARSAETGFKTFVRHSCHLGITICGAPIIEENQPIALLLSGQVLSKPLSPKRRAVLIRVGEGFDLDQKGMERAVDELRVASLREIEGAAGLLQALVGHVLAASLSKRRSQRQAELEKMLYETELGMLQSQINPHFLFNALNTVMWMASLEKAEETVKIVCALADLLRYNLRQIGKLVPLGQEIEQVKGYLLIQKARFGDRLQVVVDVDPSAAAVDVPVLILQPLVENAIIHGLEAKVGNGTLVLQARRKRDRVVIEVKDDGEGMSPEVAHEVIDRLEKAESQTRLAGLGMMNVVRSLRHHFGDRAAMEVFSHVGRGTLVRLNIPVELPELSALETDVSRG